MPVGQIAPLAPPDWWRAMAVALLNLTGLGLGFVLIRRWRAAIACWLVTAVLLLIALPATPNGIPIGVTVLYIAFLVLVAVLGALRGLRTPLLWPPRAPVAFGLAVVLLVVPLGAAVLFDNARQEAYQQMLLKRLTQADNAITSAEFEPIATAEPQFVSNLATFQDLLDHHGTSRAAKLVPGRLQAFYQVVSSPYSSGDYCNAIEPLKFLRTLPTTAISARDLGSLATFPDDRLATSLYQCGTHALGSNGDPTAAQDLNDLMSTFPGSAQAGKVEPAVAAAITSAAGGLTGSDPCSATTQITSLGGQVSALTTSVAAISDGLKKDVGTVNGDVEAGTYDCAVSKYKGGDFAGAQTAMDSFVSTYPNDPNKALAQKYSIAAQIAQQDADAGKVTPTLTTGGSVSITIFNDSPDAMQILYTGPATGTINIGACSGCKVYATAEDAQQNACGDSSIDYPKASFTLPPGTTYLLQKSTNTDVTDYTHSDQYAAGSVYQLCAYEKSPFGGLGL
ncbi:TolA-binding protein [Catenulispora sp. GP43]|uniref:hypothetical protein n=1 Tax=Catenulispora sp. GP43 TaxID=3156263 RepID=UPI0035134FDD